MNITVAKSAGFCFGVKRAVNKVYEQADISNGPIYTYGPIIHNEEVVNDLERKGVQVIDSIDSLAGSRALKRGTVIIRSHGVSKEVYEKLEQAGFSIEDATCPFVLKIHQIVEEFSKDGYEIVIIGSSEHPEVEGIRGWCDPAHTAVVSNAQEAENYELQADKKVCIVAQTTFNYKKFQELVEIIQKKGYNVNVVNTICNATEERQAEAKVIASQVDAMIVIGGNHSSNTKKLYEICRKECENTCFIQTLDGLRLDFPDSVIRVGITAGASTPNNIIEEVQNYVRVNF